LQGSIFPPPTYIRLNTLRGPQEDTLAKIKKEKIKLEKVERLKHVFKVIGVKKPLTQTTSFKKGRFYIQDKASCYATECTHPTPNVTVLDVCAAPGAKTTYLAQLMDIIYKAELETPIEDWEECLRFACWLNQYPIQDEYTNAYLQEQYEMHLEYYQGEFATEAEFAEEFMHEIGAIDEEGTKNLVIDWQATYDYTLQYDYTSTYVYAKNDQLEGIDSLEMHRYFWRAN